MSEPAPESWDSVRSRLTTLLVRRAAVLDDTAAAWVRFARETGWRRADMAALWDGLTEDLVRRYTKTRPETAETVRQDVLAAMNALRERILTEVEQ
jgi:hypothetical protein